MGGWVEFCLLFLGIPLGLAWAQLTGSIPVPVIPVLIGLSVVMAAILYRDPTFSWREAVALRWDWGVAAHIVLRFAVLAGFVVSLLVWVWIPDKFMKLPREQPELWGIVMVGYPLLSVLPQEFLYRTFLFHRFGETLGGPSRTVAASAIAFAVAHLLFGNWIAVAMTLVGGLLFSLTYRRTRSLWLASFEHTLYGHLVFTVGLGEYFYGGTLQAVGGP